MCDLVRQQLTAASARQGTVARKVDNPRLGECFGSQTLGSSCGLRPLTHRDGCGGMADHLLNVITHGAWHLHGGAGVRCAAGHGRCSTFRSLE